MSFPYRTLAVRLRKHSAIKHLFIKPQSQGDDEAEYRGRSLFVAGLPLRLNSSHVQDVFQVFGEVEKVRQICLMCARLSMHGWYACDHAPPVAVHTDVLYEGTFWSPQQPNIQRQPIFHIS